jgi:hypothetical protein
VKGAGASASRRTGIRPWTARLAGKPDGPRTEVLPHGANTSRASIRSSFLKPVARTHADDHALDAWAVVFYPVIPRASSIWRFVQRVSSEKPSYVTRVMISPSRLYAMCGGLLTEDGPLPV